MACSNMYDPAYRHRQQSELNSQYNMTLRAVYNGLGCNINKSPQERLHPFFSISHCDALRSAGSAVSVHPTPVGDLCFGFGLRQIRLPCFSCTSGVSYCQCVVMQTSGTTCLLCGPSVRCKEQLKISTHSNCRISMTLQLPLCTEEIL